MDRTYKIKKIGKVNAENGIFSIQLEKEFITGLTNIDGFTHLQVVWWGHLYDSPKHRDSLVIEKPYKTSPDRLGVFGTRSERRPNPILITTINVIKIDKEAGKIYTPYIDAENGTDVLDIKPYHLMERIKECKVPAWCKHWPKWYEEAGNFDWQNEFNF
jgi:tRNA (Thr-GGU) A37 N-methylase